MASAIAHSQTTTRETVRLVSSQQDDGAKHIVMQSQTVVYVFNCNEGAAGCIVPVPDRPYYLITDSQPLGKMDMNWLKNWYVEYHEATNMGIVPAWKEWSDGWKKFNDNESFMREYRGIGVYWLVSLTVRK
jgi:hypothetical protein